MKTKNQNNVKTQTSKTFENSELADDLTQTLTIECQLEIFADIVIDNLLNENDGQ